MILPLFEKNINIEESKLHYKFKTLKNSIYFEGERSILLNWTDGFIDRDNKIVKEFQASFHSAFFEFFLYEIFKRW